MADTALLGEKTATPALPVNPQATSPQAFNTRRHFSCSQRTLDDKGI
jgi:hypothetical protein